MAKIPVRGINPALKKATENLAKKAQVDDAVKGVKKIMSQTAESAKPVQQLIDDTLNINIPRRANGKRIQKSAKESASVFVNNIDDIKLNEIISDDAIKRTRIVNENRQRSSDLREKFSKRTANNTDEAFRNGEISARRQQLKDNTRDLSDRGSRLEERQRIKNSPNESFIRRQEAQSIRSTNTNADSIGKKKSSADNKPGKKKKDPKADNWVYKAAAAGVGGGLVLSMSNSKGQQSNQQLYGQGGY